MRKIIILIVALTLGTLSAATNSYADSWQNEERICEICAVLDSTGTQQKVTVTGRRFAKDSEYFTDIKINLTDGREIIPDTDEGYGAGIAAFDFTGDGYCQLFYFASSGGSGGYGYFYVFDCSKETVKVLFDYQKFQNVYTAKYADDYRLDVYKDNKLFVSYDVSGYENERELWDSNGVFTGDAQPYVTDLNFVEPVFVYSLNRYRLNVWQNVVGKVSIDVVGHIITALDFGKGKYSYVAVSAA